MTGRSPSGPGSRASHEAANASSPEASIPNALDDFYAAQQEEFNRIAGTDNWRMHDTPKLSPEYFDKLLGIFGEGNYRFMVGSQGNVRIRDGKSETCEPWVRATLLISPEAVANAQRHASGMEAPSGVETGNTGSTEGDSPVGEAETPE